MSTDLSTPGSATPGATVLVASGIVHVAAGNLPLSALAAPGAVASDGQARKGFLAA